MHSLLTLLNLTSWFTVLPVLTSTQFDSKEYLSNDRLQKLFAVNLHLSTFPGDEIVVFGKERNITDPLGRISYVVDFLGIRFAKPPVDNLRFQRPSMETLRHDIRALQQPSPCPQLDMSGVRIGNEDCLHLNIYVPKRLHNDTSKMPVLVWFHGASLEFSKQRRFGWFSTGSARDLNPSIFLVNNVIVVTPQYRLGSFGYLSTGNEDLSGNMALFDKLLALEWVKKYIADFGGDASQITVMAHGSAAMEMGLLTTSNLAKGLFHRAILMGGSPLSPVALDSKSKSTYAEIALQNSCPTFPTLRFVRCMQQKSIESILRADQSLYKGKHLGKMQMPLPVIQKNPDGRFLPPILSRNPVSSLSTGTFEQIPIIVGGSAAELNGFLTSISGGEPHVSTNVFVSKPILKQFIRAILSRSTDSELLSELVTFEYFAGLNISDPARQEQATDAAEEMVADYLFHVPSLHFAKLWSKYAPAYFYVFDYVSDKALQGQSHKGRRQVNSYGTFETDDSATETLPAQQAFHGSDVSFLMDGYDGSGIDREIANIMIDLWVNFIHHGSPLHSGMQWPQFREDTKGYLHLSKYPTVEYGFHERQEQLWTSVFETVSKNGCKPQFSSESFKLFDKLTKQLNTFSHY